MACNWNQSGWPNFSYDSAALEPLERKLLLRSGEFIGAYKHVGPMQPRDLERTILPLLEKLK